ncbi:MAG: hypothetical protein HYW01_11095 [Deltaproteobacteria bacterium]|nr:hypothetical protein [Deltaproteobacteria bacterium]
MVELIKILLKLVKADSRVSRSGLVSLGLSLIVIGLSWILIIVGLMFIIWALYLYLSTFLSPYITALITGLTTLLVACCLVWSTKLIMRKERKAHEQKAESKEVLRNISSVVQDYPLETALAVVALGFLLGTSSKSREALAESIIWLHKQNPSNKD